MKLQRVKFRKRVALYYILKATIATLSVLAIAFVSLLGMVISDNYNEGRALLTFPKKCPDGLYRYEYYTYEKKTKWMNIGYDTAPYYIPVCYIEEVVH